MKNKFLTLLISAVGALSLSACSGGIGEVDFNGAGDASCEYLALEHVVMNLAEGESKDVSVKAFPASYAKSELTFKSENKSVATVDKNGKVKGVAKGVTDILVTSKDGSLSRKVRVVVSKKSKPTASDVKTAVNNINAVYEDEHYEAPTKVLRHEYSYENYSCEGVVDHGMESYEVMGYDTVEGYFFVEGPTVYTKTQHGAPEVKDGKWIFYPINYGIYTRLIHITPRGKTFFDINTANYESYDSIIRDIINFFFVSGEKILTNLLEDYEGKDDLADYADGTCYSVDNNSLYFELTEKGSDQVVSADDEINYMDIPADTVYSYDYKQCLLNQSGRTTGLEIGIKMDYKLNDGKNWSREFFRSQLFESDFEIEKVEDPANNGYTEVDNIYDL